MTKISAILLAGGIGSRMGASIPKQFLPMHGKTLVLYSFELLISSSRIDEVIVVCRDEFRHLFPKGTLFASPGERRQDSVHSALQKIASDATVVCIHDAARPLLDETMLNRVLDAGTVHGAATVGVPLSFTVKECNDDHLVVATPNRANLWEIQTPQVIRRDLLEKGFAHCLKHNLEVTDDVSLVEALGIEVKVVEGSDSNLKITTPKDLLIAKQLIQTQ